MQKQHIHKRKISRIAAICLMFCILLGITRDVRADDTVGKEEYKVGLTTGISVDVSQKGSISIKEKHGAGISYSLYQIAVFSNDGQAYYTETFYPYKEELTMQPSLVTTAEKTETLAADFVTVIQKHGIASMMTADTGADGTVSFSQLAPGYYLITAESFTNEDGAVFSANPILVTIPEEDGTGNYNLSIQAKSELTTAEKPENPTTPKQPKTTTKKTTSVDKTLPRTGVLWWPVPVLAAAGIALYLAGCFINLRKRKSVKGES